MIAWFNEECVEKNVLDCRIEFCVRCQHRVEHFFFPSQSLSFSVCFDAHIFSTWVAQLFSSTSLVFLLILWCCYVLLCFSSFLFFSSLFSPPFTHSSSLSSSSAFVWFILSAAQSIRRLYVGFRVRRWSGKMKYFLFHFRRQLDKLIQEQQKRHRKIEPPTHIHTHIPHTYKKIKENYRKQNHPQETTERERENESPWNSAKNK